MNQLLSCSRVIPVCRRRCRFSSAVGYGWRAWSTIHVRSWARTLAANGAESARGCCARLPRQSSERVLSVRVRADILDLSKKPRVGEGVATVDGTVEATVASGALELRRSSVLDTVGGRFNGTPALGGGTGSRRCTGGCMRGGAKRPPNQCRWISGPAGPGVPGRLLVRAIEPGPDHGRGDSRGGEATHTILSPVTGASVVSQEDSDTGASAGTAIAVPAVQGPPGSVSCPSEPPPRSEAPESSASDPAASSDPRAQSESDESGLGDGAPAVAEVSMSSSKMSRDRCAAGPGDAAMDAAAAHPRPSDCGSTPTEASVGAMTSDADGPGARSRSAMRWSHMCKSSRVVASSRVIMPAKRSQSAKTRSMASNKATARQEALGLTLKRSMPVAAADRALVRHTRASSVLSYESGMQVAHSAAVPMTRTQDGPSSVSHGQ